MGLTKASVGSRAREGNTLLKRRSRDKLVALAGNPNVGKSTIFNALTGLNQHTGNWPGKTVAGASGYAQTTKHSLLLADVPGAYSLLAHSAEEEVARNFICFGGADAVIVVCDATRLERNLNLVLQTLEVTRRIVVCVNLLDEAAKKHIEVDIPLLSQLLGVPVVGVVAREQQTLSAMLAALDEVLDGAYQPGDVAQAAYPPALEEVARRLSYVLPGILNLPESAPSIDAYWLALRLLENDENLIADLERALSQDFAANKGLQLALKWSRECLQAAGLSGRTLQDAIVNGLVRRAEKIAGDTVHCHGEVIERDMRLDKLFCGRFTAYPFMLLGLAGVFWLSIIGANYPSEMLSALFARGQEVLSSLLFGNVPIWLHDMLVLGVYRTVAWVVSVMLPPMAIFFPLFTLLEDVGYLPRVAYNLDKPFRLCKACGKQALTMCMGFGCNAAGVIGCRIIDSPRERLLAILTNSLVPCNGRFPTLISLLTLFCVGASGGVAAGFSAAMLLTLLIMISVAATFMVTRLLSDTVLAGEPSSFALELPSYRRPQILSVLVRSVLDRTLFVLGRAVMAAAPAGLLIWLLANIPIAGGSMLTQVAAFLDPFAAIFGLDGVILLAFILGLPANEIVVPIMLMCYLAEGTLVDAASLAGIKELLLANGWTFTTACCTLLFMLFHWPCATTLLTIRKETASLKWTALAAAIPTALGFALCFIVATLSRLIV